eukprot:3824635-Prymnesium_polylepis.1
MPGAPASGCDRCEACTRGLRLGGLLRANERGTPEATLLRRFVTPGRKQRCFGGSSPPEATLRPRFVTPGSTLLARKQRCVRHPSRRLGRVGHGARTDATM